MCSIHSKMNTLCRQCVYEALFPRTQICITPDGDEVWSRGDDVHHKYPTISTHEEMRLFIEYLDTLETLMYATPAAVHPFETPIK